MHSIAITEYGLNDELKEIDGVGVYSFRDSNGRYLYIGQSVILYERMLSHKGFIRKLISEYGMKLISIAYCDEEQLDDLERRAIDYHNPIFNRAMNIPTTYVDVKLKVPAFMAFKLKEMSVLSKNRDISSIAMEGLEYVLSR